ncbi:MAG: hypothetical protein ACKO4S_03640 [Snowella sp.]
MAKFRITNILKQQSLVNQMIFQQAKTKKIIFNRLETILKLEVAEINELCQKNQVTPADLQGNRTHILTKKKVKA